MTMTIEGIVAIVVATGTALGVAGGFAYNAGVYSYRFTESGEKSQESVKGLRQDMEEEHKRIREEMDGRFKMAGNDINAMGRKINEIKAVSETDFIRLSREAQRHHHRISLAIMLVAPSPKEAEVVQLLKEE